MDKYAVQSSFLLYSGKIAVKPKECLTLHRQR